MGGAKTTSTPTSPEYHEDRIAADGKHEAYAKDMDDLRSGNISADEMYEKMTQVYGMSAEEADASLALESGDE